MHAPIPDTSLDIIIRNLDLYRPLEGFIFFTGPMAVSKSDSARFNVSVPVGTMSSCQGIQIPTKEETQERDMCLGYASGTAEGASMIH